ncbi:tryptophan synthase subunit alpha [Thiomicrospira sp. ALE5]|uniref:tryptophan synthase subunit alpha n=1 Tax=Thiomicrospira sp. ALE5 TaxID=748650 RepID=UPI0008EBDC1C|nr:tryptophan synthase subunit alpha [Thiomicrospira sp. ALE5]SFR48791.1 tryptophan synthase, alpha chain [Thiomicrospira sp. ALE5]
MNRIEARFASLQAQQKTALIPYITAGDPHPDMTVALMHHLVAQGADLLELGVPFSDPLADGPTIQKAVERALAHRVTLRNVLAMVTKFRERDDQTPVILMGYLNPIEAMGEAEFAKSAVAAGLDGVLTVDMPPEESVGYHQTLAEQGLACVFLVSPTTPSTRLGAIAEQGKGFVYYVSLKGVTGVGQADAGDVASHVAALKQHVDLPVGIGFGVRDAQAAYKMAQHGEAVIIGSVLVNIIEQYQQAGLDEVLAALTPKMAEFRQAIDAADKGESL